MCCLHHSDRETKSEDKAEHGGLHTEQDHVNINEHDDHEVRLRFALVGKSGSFVRGSGLQHDFTRHGTGNAMNHRRTLGIRIRFDRCLRVHR